MKHRLVIANAALMAGVVAAGLLLRYPPESNGFYPACPVFAYLHVLCPGCGTTRALSALLHGRVAEAMRLNLLSVALLPFGLVYAGVCYGRAMLAAKFVWPEVSDLAGYATLAAAAVFGVGRNLL